MRQIDDRQRAVGDLAHLAEVATRWQAEIADRFRKETMETAGASAVSPINAALQRFDAMPRTQRLQAMLIGGREGKLLSRLSEKHEVQLFAMERGQGGESVAIRRAGGRGLRRLRQAGG